MWWGFAALLNGFTMVLIGLLGDRHVSPHTRTSVMLLNGTFIVVWEYSAPPTPGYPWVRPTALVMLTVGAFAGLVRSQLLMRRQRDDPSLDPWTAFDSNSEGRLLLRRFDSTSDVETLSRGIELLRLAVQASSGDPRRTEYAANLVMALRGRYQRLGDPADLDDAIEIGRNAAQTEPVDDPRRGGLLSQLSSALRARYDHFGDGGDLDEAIKLGREAVGAASVHYPEDRVLCLGELSAVLRSRYERTQDLSDLNDAIGRLELAMLTTQSGNRPYVRVAHLTTLCLLLVQRYGRTENPSDLDRALDVGRQAAQRVSAGYRLYERCQLNLALALRVRYEHIRNEADLHEAIDVAQRALADVSADDPGRAGHLLNLALAVYVRYQATGDRTDLRKALASVREAATHPATELSTRVTAGLAWSDIAASASNYTEAVEAFDGVIGLLPQVASSGLRRVDQEHRLGQWTGIAVTAAACAVADARSEKAVALLEQGRGVLLSRALDVRTDLSVLRGRHPGLADEFEELRRGLNVVYEPHPTSELDDEDAGMGRERVRKLRHTLVTRWDSLLQRIRAHEGFADFARGPGIDELLAQTQQGPLVFLNVSKYRSDAIILDSGGVRTLHLPEVTPQAVNEQVLKLIDSVQPEHLLDQHRQRRFDDVLAWLWDALVEPVVDALDIHAPQPGQDWSRVWWVPTGPLAVLPIHAAGHHDTRDHPEPRTLLDRAISSYAPTVRALADARARRPAHTKPRPLVVAMSKTPGGTPLDSAPAEANTVRHLFPDTQVLVNHEATVERVLAELPHRTWAHFACHAVTDVDSPSQGGLLLHDHEQRSFSVIDISRLDLRNVELAYLSSCDTAQPGLRLSDEAIHLASSFQLAGFSHVIATLWPLRDRVAVEFATQVYQQLEGSVRSGAGTDSASAVHHAVRAAREMYPNFAALWAGHIHVGP